MPSTVTHCRYNIFMLDVQLVFHSVLMLKHQLCLACLTSLWFWLYMPGWVWPVLEEKWRQPQQMICARYIVAQRQSRQSYCDGCLHCVSETCTKRNVWWTTTLELGWMRRWHLNSRTNETSIQKSAGKQHVSAGICPHDCEKGRQNSSCPPALKNIWRMSLLPVGGLPSHPSVHYQWCITGENEESRTKDCVPFSAVKYHLIYPWVIFVSNRWMHSCQVLVTNDTRSVLVKIRWLPLCRNILVAF